MRSTASVGGITDYTVDSTRAGVGGAVDYTVDCTVNCTVDTGDYNVDYTVDYTVDYDVDYTGDYTGDHDVNYSGLFGNKLTPLDLDEIKDINKKLDECLKHSKILSKTRLEDFTMFQIGQTEVNFRHKHGENKHKPPKQDFTEPELPKYPAIEIDEKAQAKLKKIRNVVTMVFSNVEKAGIKFVDLINTFRGNGGTYEISFYPVGKDEISVLQYHWCYCQRSSIDSFIESKWTMYVLRDYEYVYNSYIFLMTELKKVQTAIKLFEKEKKTKHK